MASNPSSSRQSTESAAERARRPKAATERADGRPVPRPIGPERLRALRRAIESGRYPTDADVAQGLERILRADRD